MSDDQIPPYPTGNFLEAIHSTCHHVARNTKLLTVQDDQVSNYLKSLNGPTFKRDCEAGIINLQIEFKNFQDKVMVYALMDVMQFGHGWRAELHDIKDDTTVDEGGFIVRMRGPFLAYEFQQAPEEEKPPGAQSGEAPHVDYSNISVYKGAAQSIVDGISSMYVGNVDISAKGLQALTIEHVAHHFGLPLWTDKTGTTPSVVRPYIEQIHTVLIQNGKALQDAGYENMGEAVLKVAEKSIGEDGKPCAAVFVKNMVQLFPAFRDMGVVDGYNTYVFKKAQLLASDLLLLFGEEHPAFRWTDLDKMAIFADNVVPAMMDFFGLLKLGTDLKEKTNSGKDLTWAEALTLRAATIEVADLLVKEARSGDYHPDIKSVNAVKLGYFLWKLGKRKPDLIALPRSCCRTTVFY